MKNKKNYLQIYKQHKIINILIQKIKLNNNIIN